MSLLRIAVPSVPQSLDPSDHQTDTAEVGCLVNACQPLLRWDLGDDHLLWDRVQPALVETLEASVDWRTWTVRLRAGVQSPNGEALRADDVVWSWSRSWARNSPGVDVARASGLDGWEDVEYVDERTVRFRLTRPNACFASYLAHPLPRLIDSKTARRHSAGDLWAAAWMERHPSGFGPFVVREFVPGRSMHFVWVTGEREPGLCTEVVMRAEPDPTARVAAVIAREFDVAMALPIALAASLEGRDDLRVRWLESARTLTLRFDLTRPPFDREDVRRSIAAMAPREQIVAEAYSGHATACRSVFASNLAGYTERYASATPRPEGSPVSSDPRRARAPDASPRGGRRQIVLSYQAGAPQVTAAVTILREALEETGLAVYVRPADDLHDRAPNLELTEQEPRVPDAEAILRGLLLGSAMPAGELNPAERREATALLDQVRITADPLARAPLLGRLQELAIELMPIVCIATVPQPAVTRPDVRGLVLYPSMGLDFSRLRVV